MNRTIRTTVSIYFFVARNLYGSEINLKKNIYNTTGRKTYATTAPSVLILHSIHCCYCCCCWGCGPFLFTVKTLMFNDKFFKFRLLHSLFRIFASIKLIKVAKDSKVTSPLRFSRVLRLHPASNHPLTTRDS